MTDITTLENPLNNYLLKQEEFKKFVKDIQQSLNSKEYLKQGYTIDEFVKSKWNISKTQAYRYLLSAKIIDQLKEFKIQPNYERLCRSLNKYAKTPQQIKLLWRMVLLKINDNVDLITSTLVSRTWNELCKDKKYSHICYYEESIMNKIELTFQEHSKKMIHNQLKTSNNNNYKYSYAIPSQNFVNHDYISSSNISYQTPEISSQFVIIPSNDYVYDDENLKMNQYGIEDDCYESHEQYLLYNNIAKNQINNNFLPTFSSSSVTPISPISPLIQNNVIPNQYEKQNIQFYQTSIIYY
ncbi:hypothetical protein BCR36DRAFT_374963 [Piromyces finnis]|uniref:F-box domain-containing protein n=1 Tax=Piromyces finnis TaxID=1754191 RepID=A0A1Y1UWG6_9FUNG|nr:hypothetical protein BCR36DRAFT_374963 [Piromyces finnis]|eukprot:ORX41834.1 hypothetical protein BCR36DRAFT_374963 [Piromyces finnis]